MKNSLYFLAPLLEILSTPLPHHLQPWPPLLFLLSCFLAEWVGHCTTFDVSLNDIINLHIWYLIWFGITHIHTHTHKHTHKPHTAHPRANRLTHPATYILTPPVIWSQHLSVLHSIIQYLYQKFTFHKVFTISKLLTYRSHISVD